MSQKVFFCKINILCAHWLKFSQAQCIFLFVGQCTNANNLFQKGMRVVHITNNLSHKWFTQ